MSEEKIQTPLQSNRDITSDDVEIFLKGNDPEKYIVALEYDMVTNTIFKIKQHPEKGKLIEEEKLTAFLWSKDLSELNFYGNNIQKIKEARKKYGIEVKILTHFNHERLKNGFLYLYSSKKGYLPLINYFKYGGIDPWGKDTIQDRNGKNVTPQNYFMILNPSEQYLVANNKRLFKGFDDYNDLHKMVFDLETEGLDPRYHRIILAGMKDNRGFEKVFEAYDDNTERILITNIFKYIQKINPTIIAGYNCADFDWDFIYKRSEILNLDIDEIAYTLKDDQKIKRRRELLKVGNEVKPYLQVHMWGYNNIDVIHSVLKAQAIDSNIKKASLKYIAKYSKIKKKNRVYIPDGKNISKYWQENPPMHFSDIEGKYTTVVPSFIRLKSINSLIKYNDNKNIYALLFNSDISGNNIINIDINEEKNIIIEKIKEIKEKINNGKTIIYFYDNVMDISNSKESIILTICEKLKEYTDSFKQKNGKYVTFRYLMDDLWETMEVDNAFNQAAFLLAKLAPTTFQRSMTMGSASLWRLIMLTWSYTTKLAIPINEEKRDFIGGLSRLLKFGYSKRIFKLDYSSLYPAIQLSHIIFPTCDVMNIIEKFLRYFHNERFIAKDLATKAKEIGDKKMETFYKRKQMPLKIFINSLYGSLTAPHTFPWSEIDKGEQVTCSARQYLRLLVKFFMKRGFIPLVLDTDGVNFQVPENMEEYKYVGKGLHERTIKDKLYIGADAFIAEFNDYFMQGAMAIDLDGIWESTINFKRKNYVLLTKEGEIEIVGNSLKGKDMEEYNSEFLLKSIELLLHDKGKEWVDYYHNYVKKIWNKEIPLIKIASKSKVKITPHEYKYRGTDKNGREKGKQAHMELAIHHDLPIHIGDVIYYVNNGTSKSHGDTGYFPLEDEKGKIKKDENGEKMYGDMYAYYLPVKDGKVEGEEYGNYNVPRAIDKLNKKAEMLLTAFHPNVRDRILINEPDEAKDKLFTDEELKLCNGYPLEGDSQDDLWNDFLLPEEREIEFWKKFNYNPDIWRSDEIDFVLPGFDKKMEKN